MHSALVKFVQLDTKLLLQFTKSNDCKFCFFIGLCETLTHKNNKTKVKNYQYYV